MSSSKTPDDDGQYGASLERPARDKTRPTKDPTSLRGSGRVSGRTKRLTLKQCLANGSRIQHSSRTYTMPRSTSIRPEEEEKERIVSCIEARGRQRKHEEEDAYCITEGGHNCNAQVEYGHNDTILNRPFIFHMFPASPSMSSPLLTSLLHCLPHMSRYRAELFARKLHWHIVGVVTK